MGTDQFIENLGSNNEKSTARNHVEAVAMLRPMSDAPKDGTEILAYHKSGGNFHPVKWKHSTWKENNTSCWGMRWNDEYGQRDGNYIGWIHFPLAKAT